MDQDNAQQVIQAAEAAEVEVAAKPSDRFGSVCHGENCITLANQSLGASIGIFQISSQGLAPCSSGVEVPSTWKCS